MYGNYYQYDNTDTVENEDDDVYRSISMDYTNQNGTVYGTNNTIDLFLNISNISFNKKSINHHHIEPEYFETSFAVSFPLQALMNPKIMNDVIKKSLMYFEYNDLIDWSQDEQSIFIFDGRIFSRNDDAEFRFQIYALKHDTNRSMLELRRMAGDAFVFADFREKLVHYLTEQKYISNNNNNEDNVNYKCPENSQSPISVDNNDDIVMRFNFQDILNFNTFENSANYDCENFNLKTSFQKNQIDVESAKNLILNAKNRNCYREIFRDHILTLRRVVDDNEDLKIVAQLETVFEDLLSPMIATDSNPLLDCWAIKTLLEIVFILLPKSKSACSKDDIVSIREKWENSVQHPLGIVTFMPSQQICRLCDKCLKVLQERECNNSIIIN